MNLNVIALKKVETQLGNLLSSQEGMTIPDQVSYNTLLNIKVTNVLAVLKANLNGETIQIVTPKVIKISTRMKIRNAAFDELPGIPNKCYISQELVV